MARNLALQARGHPRSAAELHLRSDEIRFRPMKTDLCSLFGLEGYTAVITGASAGLGVEFAHAIASAGARVVLTARREERLKALANDLETAYGADCFVVAADLGRAEERERVFASIDSSFGGAVDILINNAGIAPTGKAERQWPEAWNEALELNLNAAFHCCLLARARMRRDGRQARILNVSSIFGHLGSSLFRLSAYAASKGAIENLTRQLAVEWASEGITVNAIAPAWFPSEMTAGSIEKTGVAEKMGAGCPLGRMGQPFELRTACLFLAAPASSYVTGTILPVDGGYSAW
jgi:NAD(P)-dependent dehydrogenase (short-subunit alcohol dehydrogenase family)